MGVDDSVPVEDLRSIWWNAKSMAKTVRGASFLGTERLCRPEIGRKLELARYASGLSVAELAARAKLDADEVQRLETTPGEADLSNLITVCRVLGIDPDELADQTPRYVRGREIMSNESISQIQGGDFRK